MQSTRAWPLVQARRVLERLEGENRTVIFETGYGPSGLPHIGTFTEVLRTSMIIGAFKSISDAPTKLICFSDDMDGLRKVPSNIPNKDLIAGYLGRPLCAIPDPFEEEESFGAHMHKRLTNFLDRFGFEYQLLTASSCYRSGLFDAQLLKVLERYEEIMDIMLPSLGEQRRASYSPFLPICPDTGKVLQVPIVERNLQTGTIKYLDPLSSQVRETKVTGGNCKLQWKPDFSMRWSALKVDFEMYGKDVGANEDIYQRICQVLGGKPPVLYTYEFFLDENASKISKSKGSKAVSMEEWLEYGPVESLKLFIYQNPERAKRLHLGLIPKCADEYLDLNEQYHNQSPEERLENPAHYVHDGKVPNIEKCGLNFSLILNLAAVCDADNVEVLSDMISQYGKQPSPYMYEMLQKVLNYYRQAVRSERHPMVPDARYKEDLNKILTYVKQVGLEPMGLQTYIYELSKVGANPNQKEYFRDLYKILLGQESGPRLGSLFALLGKERSEKLLKEKLAQ